ncbi:TPA: hypothetical protein ACS70J_002356 [Providencia alcalifaciens]
MTWVSERSQHRYNPKYEEYLRLVSAANTATTRNMNNSDTQNSSSCSKAVSEANPEEHTLVCDLG